MPICKSCGKKYIYLSLGNSNYCENCEPREVIYTDEEFNNTVKGIKRKRQKSINTKIMVYGVIFYQKHMNNKMKVFGYGLIELYKRI